MNFFYKTFLILFFLLTAASVKAQIFDYKPMYSLPYGYITSEQTIRAGEKERLTLANNKVKEINRTDSNNATIEKYFFDTNGRCTKKERYGIDTGFFQYTYNDSGELIKIISGNRKNIFTVNISYKNGKPVSSITETEIKYGSFNVFAEYKNDTLSVINMKDENGLTLFNFTPLYVQDTSYLIISNKLKKEGEKKNKSGNEKKLKEDTKYKSSVMTDTLNIRENTYEEPEPDEDVNRSTQKEVTMYTIISKPDTVTSIEGFMRTQYITIYKNDIVMKTKNESEDFGFITTEYFYDEKGLINYAVSTQERGKPKGKIKYEYKFYE